MFPKLYRGLPVCFCLCAAYVFCVARAADIASDADIALGVSAVNGFGFSLLSQLERTNSTGNVLISPLSISSAVGLTAEGVTADSEALAQLSSVFEGLEFPEDLEFLPSLIRLTVEGSSGVNLTSANSVWLNPEFAEGVKQSFKDNVRQRYGAQIQEFQSGQQVNAWVANVTRGLIDQAVDPSLSPSDVAAMLVNANHFKGLWTVPFETGNTQPGEFFNSNGPATVQMMGQPPSKSDYGYSSLDINGVAVEVCDSHSLFLLSVYF
uniref:Proteinase inhibitor i4 serpin n=1 Tax=Tetraselmis sp. GSL018 TaxID=582737 RepID=A0A061RN62_9CHLO